MPRPKTSDGYDVIVGLDPHRTSARRARRTGIAACPGRSRQACRLDADTLAVATIADNYQPPSNRHFIQGKGLGFSHGFSIRFKAIVPPADVDVIMVAPKGPGHLVRHFREGRGVPRCWLSIRMPAAMPRVRCLLRLQHWRDPRWVLETSFKEETESDLFGEQAVLCGGLTSLMKGFETLVEAFYDPEIAYFECIHEVKLIVDLIYDGGLSHMRYSISNTASMAT